MIGVSIFLIFWTWDKEGKEKEIASKDLSLRVGSRKGKWGGGNSSCEKSKVLGITWRLFASTL